MYYYLAIACVFGVAVAAPSMPYAHVAAYDHVSIPRYSFNYAVSDPLTGDNKAQTESRDGGVVKGSYSVAEPDGTLRVVDYAADPVSGFNAVVKRVGPAAHPQHVAVKAIAAPVAVPALATSVVHGGLGWDHGAYAGHGLAGLGGHGLGLGYGGHGDLGLGYGGHGLGGGLWKH